MLNNNQDLINTQPTAFFIQANIDGVQYHIIGQPSSYFQTFGPIKVVDQAKNVIQGFSINENIYNATIQYSNGDLYQGNIRHFKPHGFGWIRQNQGNNNCEYKGEFQNGKKCGQGTEIYSKDNSKNVVFYSQEQKLVFNHDYDQKLEQFQVNYLQELKIHNHSNFKKQETELQSMMQSQNLQMVLNFVDHQPESQLKTIPLIEPQALIEEMIRNLYNHQHQIDYLLENLHTHKQLRYKDQEKQITKVSLRCEKGRIQNKFAEELNPYYKEGELNLKGKKHLKKTSINWIKSGLLYDVRSLKLAQMGINDQDVIEISSIFTVGTYKGLKEIEFWSNDIGNIGAEAIADLILFTNSQMLREISLHTNFIEDQGAEAIANAIGQVKCQHLKLFAINNNKIGNSGAIALGKALAQAECRDLVYFAINNNKIEDEGAIGLVNSIVETNCRKLEKFWIGSNKLENKTIERLVKSLKSVNCDVFVQT